MVPIKVGELILLEENHTVDVHCSPDTGELLMDGSTAQNSGTIGDSLEQFFGERIYVVDIFALTYCNKSGYERPAYAWEYPVFLLGHWKSYAKNSIRVRAILDLAKNEFMFL